MALVIGIYNLAWYNDSVITPEGYLSTPSLKKYWGGWCSSSYPPAVGFLIKKAELFPAQNTSKELSLFLHLTCSLQHFFSYLSILIYGGLLWRKWRDHFILLNWKTFNIHIFKKPTKPPSSWISTSIILSGIMHMA